MQTLFYGYKKPEDGDRGSVFWDALSENVQKTNDHTHNGSNSAKIAAYNTERTQVTVSTGSFSVQGDGWYRSLVTITNWVYHTAGIKFLMSGGDFANQQFFPKYERVSASSFYLYMPINTQEVTVVLI